MAELKQRPGDQPLPVPNDRPDIQSQVAIDILQRREFGIDRYGTALQPHNGRDASRDLYEELLDAACYAKQGIVEAAELRARLADLEVLLEMAPDWVVIEWRRRLTKGQS